MVRLYRRTAAARFTAKLLPLPPATFPPRDLCWFGLAPADRPQLRRCPSDPGRPCFFTLTTDACWALSMPLTSLLPPHNPCPAIIRFTFCTSTLSKTEQNGQKMPSKMRPKCAQNVPKMIPKCAQNDTKTHRCLVPEVRFAEVR